MIGKRRESGTKLSGERWGLRLFFLVLLAASTGVRIALTVFPKAAVVYYDELFFTELAQNIWQGGGLTVYGAPLHFTKLLYSLVLSPFYMITDGVLRTQVISIFNAVLISSALVPGYLLARGMLKRDGQVMIALVFLAVSPNLLFSMTFMSENLYYPLLLWGFYAGWRFFARPRPKRKEAAYAALLGFLAFLLYFTKETGAAYGAAIAAALAADALKKDPGTEKRGWKERTAVPGLYLLGLLAPFVLFRVILLRDAGYSYAEQVSLTNLQDGQHLLYFFCAAGILLLYFLASVLFFPAALPVLYRGRYGRADRRLLLTVCVYTAAVAVGTAFGVSLYEDYPSLQLRVHMRYFLGAAFPFVLLWLALREESTETDARPRHPKRWPCLCAWFFALLTLAVLKNPGFGSFVDSPALDFCRLFSGTAEADRWVFPAAAAGTVLFLLAVWTEEEEEPFIGRGGNRVFAGCLLAMLIGCELFSCVTFAQNTRQAEEVTDPALAAEAEQLDQLLDTAEEPVLVIASSQWKPGIQLLNTISNDRYYYADGPALQKLVSETKDHFRTEIRLREQAIPVPLQGYTGKEGLILGNVRTVAVLDDCVTIDPEHSTETTPEGLSRFRLYRPEETGTLALLSPQMYEPGSWITFLGENPTYEQYLPEGFSDSEEEWTWNNGTTSSLTLIPATEEAKELTVEWVWRMTNGEQLCRISANKRQVFSGTIGGEEGRLVVSVPAEAYADTGVLTISFEFPQAREPGNGDPRRLAAAFETLRVLCDDIPTP